MEYFRKPGVDYTHVNFKKTSLFLRIIALYNEKGIPLFFRIANFGSYTHRRRKMLAYLVF